MPILTTTEKAGYDTSTIKVAYYVTPEQYGAIGDGVADDTVAIQNAALSGLDIKFGYRKTYAVTTRATCSNNQKVDFNGSTINTEDSTAFLFVSGGQAGNGRVISSATTSGGNALIQCRLTQHAKQMIIHDMFGSNPNGVDNAFGINIEDFNLETAFVYNIDVDQCGRMGMEFVAHLTGRMKNAYAYNFNAKDTGLGTEFGMGISFSGWIQNAKAMNVVVDGYNDIGIEFASVLNGSIENFDCKNSVQGAHAINASTSTNSYYNQNIKVTNANIADGHLSIKGTNVTYENLTYTGRADDELEFQGKRTIVNNSEINGLGTVTISNAWADAIVVINNSDITLTGTNGFGLNSGCKLILNNTDVDILNATPTLETTGDITFNDCRKIKGGGVIAYAPSRIVARDTDFLLTDGFNSTGTLHSDNSTNNGADLPSIPASI